MNYLFPLKTKFNHSKPFFQTDSLFFEDAEKKTLKNTDSNFSPPLAGGD
jgi:hypothetical protein